MKILTSLAVVAGAVSVISAPPAIAEPAGTSEHLEVFELNGPPITDEEIANMVDVDNHGRDDVSGDVAANIVGGQLSQPGSNPYMAKLLIKNTGGGVSGCGGFIVSKDIVITAQHCVDPRKKVDTVEVRYGNVKWEEGETRTTKSMVMGPGLQKGDWAVLKIDQPMNVSQYAVVANHDGHNNGPTFHAAGWGRTTERGNSVKELREVKLPFIKDELCNANEIEICAGDWERGTVDTCIGDSGGPLINFVGSKPVAVGIVSWGASGCARPKKPGHYTEISTFWKNMSEGITKLGGTQPELAPGEGNSPEPPPAEERPGLPPGGVIPTPVPPKPTNPAQPRPPTRPTPGVPNIPGRPGNQLPPWWPPSNPGNTRPFPNRPGFPNIPNRPHRPRPGQGAFPHLPRAAETTWHYAPELPGGGGWKSAGGVTLY